MGIPYLLHALPTFQIKYSKPFQNLVIESMKLSPPTPISSPPALQQPLSRVGAQTCYSRNVLSGALFPEWSPACHQPCSGPSPGRAGSADWAAEPTGAQSLCSAKGSREARLVIHGLSPVHFDITLTLPPLNSTRKISEQHQDNLLLILSHTMHHHFGGLYHHMGGLHHRLGGLHHHMGGLHHLLGGGCITVWVGCTTIWVGCITIWVGCITIWVGCITIREGCITVWVGCITVWVGCITAWVGCITVWVGSISVCVGCITVLLGV